MQTKTEYPLQGALDVEVQLLKPVLLAISFQLDQLLWQDP